MKKPFLFIISGIILLAGAALFFWTQKTRSSEKKELSQLISPIPSPVQEEPDFDEIPELELSPEELESYSRVYQDPFVLYLRKALDAYLADDSSDVNISMAAVQKEHGEGIISGLDAFDREYYKSKFIVVTINDSIAGGRDIQIMFQDKPDRIFYAWVYRLASEKEEYELRGFNSKEHFDEEEMGVLRKIYGKYLTDPELAL